MSYRFERFTLDPANRRLSRDGAAVELNARYLDALALLVGEAGRLVTKERFLDEVWRGVPVTDEALTQCIKTLRRQLGDEAGRPRFIETVPKHGYRFVAEVEDGAAAPAALAERAQRFPWRRFFLLGAAGTLGAGVAGIAGGLFYGVAASAGAGSSGGAMGAASVLAVLLWLTIAVALMGGAGVSFGIAAARLLAGRAWGIAGGALGGMIVGGAVKLFGLDAFNLLLGRAPEGITGAMEGIVLGGAVGLGAWLAERMKSPGRGAALASLCGAAAGLLITLAGGGMMGGSLDLLARQFPGSRLSLERIGALLGESGFGPASQALTGAIEGALFAGCLVGAIGLALRRLGDDA